MGNNLEEFKRFVKLHPGLNDLIVQKSHSWQEIFEEWTFYKDDRWDKYKDPKEVKVLDSIKFDDNEETIETKEDIKSSGTNIEEMMKSALVYVKKINPDSITKTVTNAQKILALISGLGIGGAAAAAKNSSTGDPLFDKRFDEWY